MTAALLPAASGPVIPHYAKASSCVLNNGIFCFDWFTQHWGDTFQTPLIQHIIVTIIAVAIGFVISFVLAVIAHRFRLVVAPITFVTSVLYTIPSIAAFEILVPITGLGYTTVLIPLVSYTLLVLFTNTLAGLSSVSPEIVDAARGNGLTDSQVLFRVEVPLALPTIFAGLRVAVVTIISLATIAAYVTNLGLGAPIFAAFTNNNFNTEFFGAGVLAILLALVADGVLVIVQRLMTPWARARRAG